MTHWVEVSISIDGADVEVAEQALEQLGALAVTLEDDADNPVLEPPPGSTPLWPTVHVRGLFEPDVDRAEVMRSLQHVPGGERPQNIRWRDVGDQDWERAWLDRFKPMQFGEKLWIVPSGMSIPHDPDNIEIRLDPGLAFGTGTHPTTALCLNWLDGFECSGQQVVDYGCGSGILAIAAALKGARQVECVDTDPQALEATTANAIRNNVGDRLNAVLPASFSKEKAGLVMANILAGPLMDLVDTIAGTAAPGAPIVLSGILAPQAEQVIEAYRPYGLQMHVEQLDEWVRIEMIRRQD